MSSITAQQTKLDLELVPKEKRLDIGKCNGRLNPRKIQREPTFQVVLDALALTLCYSAFLITADVLKVYMHQFWDSVYKHDTFYRFKIDKRKRFKVNLEVFRDIFKIGPRIEDLSHTREIHSLNDVAVDQMHQPLRTFAALINRSLSGKTIGLDKLRLSKKYISVSTEEPMGKSKRVKRPAYKSTKAPARGVFIRETIKIPLSKKKEKVDVARGKGIELLSDVALNEDAQFEEVRRKSMRDFHKTHPTGSSDEKIIPSVKSEGTGVKPGVPNVTKEESSESEVESWGNNEDDSNNEQDSSGEDIDQDPNQENDSDDNKTQSDNENESDFDRETEKNESGSESDQEEDEKGDEDDEEEIDDKAEGDEDEKMDYTTSQLYDNVDIRQNEPIDTDKGFVQEEGTDSAMTNIQQRNENLEILQVIEDTHVTLSIIPQKTEVPVTSSSHSSNLAAKFLNFSDIPHTDVEIVSPMDVHVHHEVPSQQTPTLLTVPVSVISNSSLVFSTVIPQSLPSFTSPPQQSTPPSITKATNP
ncbi:hypothetical protein Tco_0114922 [Tanacetum coccineum]